MNRFSLIIQSISRSYSLIRLTVALAVIIARTAQPAGATSLSILPAVLSAQGRRLFISVPSTLISVSRSKMLWDKLIRSPIKTAR